MSFRRISPATRNEPVAEVSEFNLQSKKKSDKGKSIFRKEDLLRPLKSKNAKLAQKLEAVKKTSALPKPLESVYEKKVNICQQFDEFLVTSLTYVLVFRFNVK